MYHIINIIYLQENVEFLDFFNHEHIHFIDSNFT